MKDLTPVQAHVYRAITMIIVSVAAIGLAVGLAVGIGMVVFAR